MEQDSEVVGEKSSYEVLPMAVEVTNVFDDDFIEIKPQDMFENDDLEIEYNQFGLEPIVVEPSIDLMNDEFLPPPVSKGADPKVLPAEILAQMNPLQQDIYYWLANIGILLSLRQIISISLRGNSAERCAMYYLENTHLFPPDAVEKNEGEEMYDLLSDPQSSSSAVFPPHPPAFRPALPTFKFTDLQRGIWREYVETGIVMLTDKQVATLSMKSNSVDGCMTYYFDNPNLFACDDTGFSGNNSQQQSACQSVSTNSGKNSSTCSTSFKGVYIPNELPPVQAVCCICQDEYPKDDLYSLNCVSSHSLCPPCLTHYIKINTLGDDNIQPHIPACPLANGPTGCKHLISQEEVCQVMDIAMNHFNDDGTQLISDREGHSVQRAICKLYLAKANRDLKHVQCVTCAAVDDESSWFALSSEGDTQNVTCPKCETKFCTHCQRTPCHYRSTCDEVMAYSRAWNEWLQGGRDAFIEELRRQNAQFNAEFAEFQNKKQSYEKEKEAAIARYNELRENETYKAQRCKRCPGCNRTIEKLDGCDSMICGQNYHGGDIQNGCGHRFNWSQAPAYVADAGQARTPAEIDTPEPAQTQQVRHMICAEQPLPCDNCSEPIVGPCIRCINCPAYNICLQCSTQDHLKSREHTKAHICTVIFYSEKTH